MRSTFGRSHLTTLVVLFTALTTPFGFPQKHKIELLVTGGTVVTMDPGRKVIEDGAVAMEKGRIIEVGPRVGLQSRYEASETIDATGQLVIPGLINGHTHVPMTLFRGLADDLDLQDWLNKYIFPAEAKNVTEEFVRAGTRLGLAEMIRGGITTYCDMYYFEDAVADETAKAGVRGVLGETVIDFPVADNKTNAQAMAYAERFIRKWKEHPLITPAIAPHSPYTVSEEHLRAVRALSDRTGSPVIIHVAETRKEIEDIKRRTGLTSVTYLEKIGFLNDRVICAHMIYLTDEEIAIVKRLGSGVVHNPQSNMKLASGVARIPLMLRDDLSVGLGTDSAASNNDLNLWEEMDTAAKLHKVFQLDPKAVSALQAFEMATIRGARALHMDSEIGSIEAGKRGDVVILDLDVLNQTPVYNIYSDLVYAAKAADVRTVIIQGRVVMRDRRLQTLDEKDIRLRAGAFRNAIIKSLALPDPARPGN